jgi:hypothetical protein
MRRNPELYIKGVIVEKIVEELLRDLGFFVMKLGQENTLNPLVQMKNFITSCGGKFRLDYYDDPITMIRTLPDFVIVDKNGNVNFLEVKFRANAFLKAEHKKVFGFYPTLICVVNLYVDEDVFKREQYFGRDSFPFPIPEYIRESRFHVLQYTGIDANTELGQIGAGTIEMWLALLGIEVNNEIKTKINRYEKLVEKWLQK